MIDLPKFKIGNLEINLIQGGMGVGISGSSLASAVANCGGLGIIASVGLGLLKNYPGNYTEANAIALRKEIRTARKMSNGAIGVNVMEALSDYKNLVKVAIEENIEALILGAGLHRNFPELVEEYQVGKNNTAFIPIVSSLKAAELITKAWKRHRKVPDAFIVEGPKAGGHLGFDYDDLINNTTESLEHITKQVINFSKGFDHPIPVIAAGGIYTGKDIYKAVEEWGASGVQMATRFVTTKECDADDAFKQAYLSATKKDLVIIKSPVGLPGRAINNLFLERVMNGETIKFDCNSNCLKSCDPKESPYCIAEALTGAQKGDFKNGFAFAGANAYKSTQETCLDKSGDFIAVETLMQRLSKEYHSS